VLLHTVEGELLDRSGPYPLLERVVSTVVINGHTLPPLVSGITEPPPGLEARLERRDRLQAELETLLQNSAQARVIADRDTALERLTQLLRSARANCSSRIAGSARTLATGGCSTMSPSPYGF
jgi:hypothetical protein